MLLSAVQIVQNRLILPSFTESEVKGQKAGVRLHTKSAWFFKALNLAYDVKIDDKIYTLNAASYEKWRKRINDRLIRPVPLNYDVNSQTMQKFFDNLFAPLPPIISKEKKPQNTATLIAHPSLSPDHILNNPDDYSTQSDPVTSITQNKASRYAMLAKQRKEEENRKVQQDLARLEKAKAAKKNGLLQPKKAVKNELTDDEREQARYFLRLTGLSE